MVNGVHTVRYLAFYHFFTPYCFQMMTASLLSPTMTTWSLPRPPLRSYFSSVHELPPPYGQLPHAILTRLTVK